jgi:hypothetical protein
MYSLWIDLSTARNWKGPPVGIVRTEFMVAREFLAAGVPGLRFCHYDRERSEYREIPRPAAEEILQRLETTADPNDSPSKPWLSALHACRSKLEWAALLRSLPPVRRSRHDSDRPVLFSHGDGYLSMGLDWDFNDLKVLGAISSPAQT